jgi:hypothetical protein
MSIIFRIILVLSISISGAQSASAHGGGLDGQGGHNCRTGSCAGTYHCHQALGGACAPKSESKTSILCKKGEVTKKISGVKPKCPTGFKLKK